jgi:hypothetical protein
LSGNRFDFSSICQIAFFLGLTVEDIVNPSLTKEQIEQEEKTHYVRNAEPIDWEQFDTETAPMIEQLAKDIYTGVASDIGRPERVSVKNICQEFNISEHRFKNLPKCKSAYKKYEESYPESWARKVIWAYKKLREENEVLYWSDIRKLAGVKKHKFISVIPYLAKYTDKPTIQNITLLVGMDDGKI